MSELDQLRQEAEQLKNQIRVSNKHLSMFNNSDNVLIKDAIYKWNLYNKDRCNICPKDLTFLFQDARKACADATLSQVTFKLWFFFFHK